MSFAPLDKNLLQTAVAQLAADSLTSVRQDALANFVDLGLPTTRHEDWRYTNLSSVADIGNRWLREFGAGENAAFPEPTDGSTIGENVDAFWIDLRGGEIDAGSLDAFKREIGAGVSISRLSESNERPELHTDDALSSLNAALMADALYVRIESGVALPKPIGFLLNDVASGASIASQTRILLDVATDANVEFVEAHQSTGAAEHFANGVVEIEVAAGARVRYVKIQERDERHVQIGRLLARLARDSTFEHSCIDIGGGLVRNDVVLTLAGAGATASSSGVYLAHGKQHVDNHIHADHRVGPATSRQNYRGIAAGRSRCVFNGKAVVHEGADGTDAEQSNHNLLLSDRAEVDTKPELEIYADDVKCSHGATIGQLDKTALFYLRSRGLDRERAAQILTRAFASRIVADVPVAGVKHYVEQLVDRKLDALVELDVMLKGETK